MTPSPERIEALRQQLLMEERRGSCDSRVVLDLIEEREQLLDALRAVHEALNIPYAATTGGRETRAEILDQRAMHAEILLAHILEDLEDGPDVPTRIRANVGPLRAQLAKHPPTYVTYEQAQAATAEGKSWAEAVTPPEPSAAADELAPAPAERRPGGPDRGGWGTDVPAAESAATLRRAADRIEETGYEHVDVVGAIVQAASETRALSPTDSDLAHAATKDLAEHLRYDTSRDSRHDLYRWGRIRSRAQIVAELLAAADGLAERGEGQ